MNERSSSPQEIFRIKNQELQRATQLHRGLENKLGELKQSPYLPDELKPEFQHAIDQLVPEGFEKDENSMSVNNINDAVILLQALFDKIQAYTDNMDKMTDDFQRVSGIAIEIAELKEVKALEEIIENTPLQY